MFHNISQLSCRILIIVLLLIFSWQKQAVAKFPLEITVEGLDSPLYENVLARLKINIHKDSERVSLKNLHVLHNRAEQDIRAAIAPYGYYSPRIVSDLREENGIWQARYSVRRGCPVLIGTVDVGLTEDCNDNKLLAKMLADLPLHEGDILLQDVYEQYKKKLIQTAFEEGYLDATFRKHELRIDRKHYSAEIFLQLDLGPRYKFGELRSEQQIIEHDLLKRLMPFKPGDPYRAAQLYDYQKKLYKTGYFPQVTVRGDIKGADNEVVPVDVEVTELTYPNKYTLGAGYATGTGGRITAVWENKLLNKKGHRLKLGGQVGENDISIESYYEIPWTDPRYQKVILNAAYRDLDWGDTEVQLLTVGPSLVYITSRFHYSLGVEFRNEDYTIGLDRDSAKMLVPFFRGSYALADDLVNTKNGIQVSGSVRGGTDSLMSDTNFLQFTASSKIVFSPFAQWRVLGRGFIGFTLADDLEDLPPSLRFWAGGDNSVRGYREKEIGSEDSQGKVIGGLYSLVGSVELERTFTDYFAGALFWDFGNATDDIEFEFHHGVGVGGRLNLPFGQLKLDVASAISESGMPVRIHFSVGGQF